MDRGQERQGGMDWKKEALVRQEGVLQTQEGKAIGQEEDSILEMAKVTPQAHKHSATPPPSQGRRHGRQQGTQVGPAGRALRKEGEA